MLAYKTERRFICYENYEIEKAVEEARTQSRSSVLRVYRLRGCDLRPKALKLQAFQP
jgi:hypothetical protein